METVADVHGEKTWWLSEPSEENGHRWVIQWEFASGDRMLEEGRVSFDTEGALDLWLAKLRTQQPVEPTTIVIGGRGANVESWKAWRKREGLPCE